MDPDATLSREQFASLLGKIDSGLRALPATAQVASQQGAYLAGLLRVADGNLDGEVQWRRRQCLPVGGLAMFLAYPVPTHPAVAATAAAAVSQSCRPMRASNTSTRDPWPMWDAVRGVRGGVERSALCPRVFPTCSLLDCTPPPSADRAVIDLPIIGPMMGLGAGVVWRGFETWSQISFRTKVGRVGGWPRSARTHLLPLLAAKHVPPPPSAHCRYSWPTTGCA